MHEHHVDVAGTGGDALRQDQRTFVDHREHQTFDDLLGCHHQLRHAEALGFGFGQRRHFRIRHRLAVDILEDAGVGLLTEATHLGQLGDHAAIGRIAGLLFPLVIDLVEHVETGQVRHGIGAHCHTPVVGGLVDGFRRIAFQKHALCFAHIGEEHAIADETETHAHQHRLFADGLGHRHGGGDDILGSFLAAYDFEQGHDIGGREEVPADDVLRTLGGGRYLIDVQGRGVAGQDRAGLGDLVELGEDFLLERHVLEHRFDDQIAITDTAVVDRAGDQTHTLVEIGLGHTAFLQGVFVVAADDA